MLRQEQDGNREDRVGHEFKEWLVHTARTVDKGSFENHEVDERRLSSQDVMSRLSPDIIAKLRRKFDHKPAWPPQDACDNVGS